MVMEFEIHLAFYNNEIICGMGRICQLLATSGEGDESSRKAVLEVKDAHILREKLEATIKSI